MSTMISTFHSPTLQPPCIEKFPAHPKHPPAPTTPRCDEVKASYFVPSMYSLNRTTTGRFTCTPSSLPSHLGRAYNTCERLTSPCTVKPYFDSESYHDNPPSPQLIDKLFSNFKSGVLRVFASQPSRVEPDIITAQRHGFDPKRKQHKVSFRAWVINYKIEYTLIKDAIIAVSCSDQFDVSVYKPGEQLMGCVGCTKGRGDTRILTPMDSDVPLSAYIIQHLEGDEEQFVLTVPPAVVGRSDDEHDAIDTTSPSPEEAAQLKLVADHPINRLTSVASAETTLKYLNLLSKHRWDDRQTWVSLATILKNSHGDELKDDWVQLSKLSPKFDAEEAELVWDTVARPDYQGRKLSLRTLVRWANEDDPLGCHAVRISDIPPAFLERFRKGDRGLAEMAFMLLSDRIKRCGKDGAFYVFDKEACVWTKGQKDMAFNPMSRELETVLIDISSFYQERATASASDEGLQKKFLDLKHDADKMVARVQSYSGILAILNLAAPMFHDSSFDERLDSVPHLLGVRNGVVDLRTGDLRAREPEDNIFTVVDVAYNPAASTAIMDDLVLSIMADHQGKAKFLQRLLGYGITGEVCEEVFAVFTGSGRNGKGVISKLLADVLGSRFFKVLNPAIICDRQVSNIDAERGNLMGSRIAIFRELPPGEKLKTNEVQLLSGGDGIPATPKYKDPMVMTPHHLCILETNHMPELDMVIPAIMNRLICVDFPVTFTDLLPGEEPSQFRRQCNTTLKGRLRNEHASVLKWLVDGAVAWYAERNLKRNAPDEVHEFTQAYFEDQDSIAQFLSTMCECAHDKRVGSSELYNAYSKWIFDVGGKAVSDKAFAAAMKHKGFVKKKTRVDKNGIQGYEGLGLLPAAVISGTAPYAV